MKRIVLAVTWGAVLALPYPAHVFSIAQAADAAKAESHESRFPQTRFAAQAERQPGSLQTVSLRDQLEKGLKARRPVEFEFIDSVLAAIELGKLPVVEVQKVFLWARKQKPYPFPYFERRMRMVADDFGVAL